MELIFQADSAESGTVDFDFVFENPGMSHGIGIELPNVV